MRPMRKAPIWLALLLILPCLALAGEPLPHGQGVLWTVEIEGVAPSYVFGTVHSADPRVAKLPAKVIEAFGRAGSVILETVEDKAAVAALARSGQLPRGRRLDRMVGAELFAKVAAVGAGYGFPADFLKTLKPWMVTVMFTLPPREFARVAGGAPILDRMLEEWARRDGKTLLGVETGKEQIAIFNGMTEGDQIAILEATLLYAGEAEALWEATIRSYLAGDLDGLNDRFTDRMTSLDPEIARVFKLRLVDARNERMAARLDAWLRRGAVFVAVGALHLPGRLGLLSLLQARGFRIARLY
jgi:uncharacterized protein YbaP (TraB family)